MYQISYPVNILYLFIQKWATKKSEYITCTLIYYNKLWNKGVNEIWVSEKKYYFLSCSLPVINSGGAPGLVMDVIILYYIIMSYYIQENRYLILKIIINNSKYIKLFIYCWLFIILCRGLSVGRSICMTNNLCLSNCLSINQSICLSICSSFYLTSQYL